MPRRLDGYQLILLRRPADAPAFDGQTLDQPGVPPGTQIADGIPVELD